MLQQTPKLYIWNMINNIFLSLQEAVANTHTQKKIGLNDHE